MVLDAIIFNICLNYIIIIMVTLTLWPLFILNKLNIYGFKKRQTNLVSLTRMGFFPFSKGATTFFKPVYKCC